MIFSSLKLRLARQRRGLSKKDLALAVKVTPRAVSMFESDDLDPSVSTITEISRVLSFPVEFFYNDVDVELLDEGLVSFRAMSKMTAAKKNAALGAGTLAIMLNRWIENRFDLPKVDLIEINGNYDPDTTATMLRQYWGIGDLPIRNVIHLLEAKGIRVFSLSEKTADIDAYSFWKDSVPYIFLNTFKSAERSKFDAAHELGHLIMHKHASPNGREAEVEADQFASAFLMPKSSINASVSIWDNLQSLIEKKAKWGISLSALIYRMHKLGILSDWNYRTLCIEVSSRGYSKNEPNGVVRETSKVWNMVFDSLRSEGISKSKVAESLHIDTKEIDALIFGLILVEQDDNKNYIKANVGKDTNNSKTYLKLVE